jgi:hypothetical protein
MDSVNLLWLKNSCIASRDDVVIVQLRNNTPDRRPDVHAPDLGWLDYAVELVNSSHTREASCCLGGCGNG